MRVSIGVGGCVLASVPFVTDLFSLVNVVYDVAASDSDGVFV